MALTEKTCTVDPGGTGDYLTLNAAEAANFKATGADLVSNDEYCVCTCICTNGAADTTAVTISGQTTDSTHTITVTVPAAYRHNGTYQTGNKYRIETTVDDHSVNVGVSFVTVYGIEFKLTTTGSNDWSVYISGNTTNVLVDSCLFYEGNATNLIGGFRSSSTTTTGTNFVRNCIAWNFTYQGFLGVQGAGSSLIIDNCTAVDCAVGVQRSLGTVTCTNCLAYCTDGFYGTIGGSNNASLNSDAPGTNAQDLAGHAGTEIFRDYANDDFHLLWNAPHVIDTGADLDQDATLPVTVDIDGRARDASTPDIGADEVERSAATGHITLGKVTLSGSVTTTYCVVDTGGSGQYSSLNAAEAGMFDAGTLNLVTGAKKVHVACCATTGVADTTAVEIDGWTTNATYTIEIHGDANYQYAGTWPSSGNYYRLNVNGGDKAIHITSDYVKIYDIPIRLYGTPTGNFNAVYIDNATGCVVERCMAHNVCSGSAHVVRGFYANLGVTDTAYFGNDVAYNFSGNSAADVAIRLAGSGTLYAYNCTAVDSIYGIQRAQGVCVAKNCIAWNCSVACYDGAFSSASTKNGYKSGASGPSGGASSINLGDVAADVFKDYVSDDFHLHDWAGNPAYAVGTNLSGDSAYAITLDIDDEPRATTPCLGFDEIAVGTHAVLGHITLGKVTASGDVATKFLARGHITLGHATAHGHITRARDTAGHITLGKVAVDGHAKVGWVVTGNLDIPTIVTDGKAQKEHYATGHVTLGRAATKGKAHRVWRATARISMGKVALDAKAQREWRPRASISLGAARVDGQVSIDRDVKGRVRAPAMRVHGHVRRVFYVIGHATLPRLAVKATQPHRTHRAQFRMLSPRQMRARRARAAR